MVTTQEQDNIVSVRRGFDAFASGDMAALGTLFDADAVWSASPVGVLTGEYRGRDQVFEFFGRLHQETGGSFRASPVSFAAAGDRVFVLETVSAKRNGAEMEQQDVLVFTLAAGKVVKVAHFLGDYPAAASFWS